MASSLPLPPGFRFHPTDEELVDHYLKLKASSPTSFAPIIADVNIYNFNPWELPTKAYSGDREWYFFSPRDRKYPNGERPNRAAASGFWKATGTDKPILSSTGAQCIGVKKSLVFYIGKPPKGEKTSWMMLEYRLLDDSLQSNRPKGSMRLDDWVLCRIRQKQTGGLTYDSSSNNSPSSIETSPQSVIQKSIQGQEQVPENVLKIYEYELLQSIMVPQEAEAEIYQDSSPEYSVSSSTLTSRVQNVPMSIPYEGNLEDLVNPRKRLNATGSILDIHNDAGSLGNEFAPNTSATKHMSCFCSMN